MITRAGLNLNYKDSVKKSKEKDLRLRALVSIKDAESGILRLIQGSETKLQFDLRKSVKETMLTDLSAGIYDIYLDDTPVQKSVHLRRGGVYTIVGYLSNTVKAVKVLTITPENSVHILWLLPQYIVITMGEVMFSVTGLEFAFTQAPISMKSLLQAAWLLTVAIGNLIVIIIAETSLMKQVNLKWCYAKITSILGIKFFCRKKRVYFYI